MNTSSASARFSATALSSSNVTTLSRRALALSLNVLTPTDSSLALTPAPLRLNSHRLRGTKYSTQRSACPADRRAGVFLWKLSSPYAEDFLRGRLLNFVGFELSILKVTCALFSWQFTGGLSAASLCQDTTAIEIFSSHFSTLCTARVLEPLEHRAVTLRSTELMSS